MSKLPIHNSVPLETPFSVQGVLDLMSAIMSSPFSSVLNSASLKVKDPSLVTVSGFAVGIIGRIFVVPNSTKLAVADVFVKPIPIADSSV